MTGLRLFLFRFSFSFCVLLSFRCLEASVLELLEEELGVVIGAIVAVVILFFLLALHHSLDEAGALHGIHVLLRVLDDCAKGVVLHDLDFDGHLLVEAHVAVVTDVAVECELASTAETLLHLELANVASFRMLQALDLDDVGFGCGVNDDDVPVGVSDEGIVFGMDVSWALILRQVVIGQRDVEGNDVGRCDRGLAFHGYYVGASDQGHDLDDFLELGKLGFVAAEEVKFSTLRYGQSAEGINFPIWDLIVF